MTDKKQTQDHLARLGPLLFLISLVVILLFFWWFLQA